MERKAKDDVMAERDLLSSRCTSEAQSLHTQLDTSQKKCAEDKNQMQSEFGGRGHVTKSLVGGGGGGVMKSSFFKSSNIIG